MGEVGRGSQPLPQARNRRKGLGLPREQERCRLAPFPRVRLGVVRNVVRPVAPLLPVREVAAELTVCRAAVYALLARGDLERVWVGGSIRIPAASLEALLARGRR